MRHPIWILNSTLLFLLIVSGLFMFFAYTTVPERESIEPDVYVKPVQKDEMQINIAKIYQDDLFGTYKKELTPVPEYVKPVPQPPVPETPMVPEIPKPQFLDPLSITLKGIIVIGYDESKNRAIIVDEKTAKEKAYKVEDTIEDAQVIKIMNNKVILLRANGQQEVLYLREHDAKNDPTYSIITGWETVIKKTGNNEYLVNPTTFLERVNNLAQFIDLLDLTTVYQKGKSIGCRIGKLEPQSMGTALGMRSSDIVTQINEITATDTPNRFAIYQEIIKMGPKDTISVEILRNNRTIMIYYTIDEFTQEKDIDDTPPTQEQLEKEKVKTLHQKHSFAPTIEELRKRERRNMLERGKAPKTTVPSSSE